MNLFFFLRQTIFYFSLYLSTHGAVDALLDFHPKRDRLLAKRRKLVFLATSWDSRT